MGRVFFRELDSREKRLLARLQLECAPQLRWIPDRKSRSQKPYGFWARLTSGIHLTRGLFTNYVLVSESEGSDIETTS